MERCGCGVGVRRGSCGLRGMQAGRGPTGARSHSSTHRRRYTRVPRPITGHPPPRARRPRTPTTVASSDNVNREQRAKVWKCGRKVRARLRRAWRGPQGDCGCVMQGARGGAGTCTAVSMGHTLGGARACTLSRGAASSASKITTTGREAAVGPVEQRSATTPRRRGARRAFGPAFWAGVSGQMTPIMRV